MSSKAESGEDFHPALFIQLEGDILLFLLNLSCYPAVFSDNTVLLDPFLSTSWHPPPFKGGEISQNITMFRAARRGLG